MSNQHEKAVDDWASKLNSLKDLAHALSIYQPAFDAVWTRASLTISEVTLAIVADRAILDSAQEISWLENLTAEEYGVKLDALIKSTPELTVAEFSAGLRLFIAKFLTIMGSVTEELLTPALHDALSSTSKAQTRKFEGKHE